MQILSLPLCPSAGRIAQNLLLSFLCLSPILATTDIAPRSEEEAAGIFGSCPPAKKKSKDIAAVGADNHVEFVRRSEDVLSCG